ncbi:MAG: hypothetical protein Q6L68_10120 [Thermostichus sp. DG02_5_bins_236]
MDPKLTSNLRLQTLVYQNVRAKGWLICQNPVAANRKPAEKRVKGFVPTSVAHDARIFSFGERDWMVSSGLDCRLEITSVIFITTCNKLARLLDKTQVWQIIPKRGCLVFPYP